MTGKWVSVTDLLAHFFEIETIQSLSTSELPIFNSGCISTQTYVALCRYTGDIKVQNIRKRVTAASLKSALSDSKEMFPVALHPLQNSRSYFRAVMYEHNLLML